MSMKHLHIRLDKARLKRLDKAAEAALVQTAEAIHTEAVQAEVIPRDQGVLQNEGTFVDASMASRGRVSIISNTPYAKRLYFHPEYKFHRDAWTSADGQTHGGNHSAKGEWWEDWLPGGKDEGFAGKAFAAFYKKEAGT